MNEKTGKKSKVAVEIDPDSDWIYIWADLGMGPIIEGIEGVIQVGAYDITKYWVLIDRRYEFSIVIKNIMLALESKSPD